jgi:hypothetical protein
MGRIGKAFRDRVRPRRLSVREHRYTTRLPGSDRQPEGVDTRLEYFGMADSVQYDDSVSPGKPDNPSLRSKNRATGSCCTVISAMSSRVTA